MEGSGIGMGIVKKLVGLSGRHRAVESKIGVGSKFTVTIPCRIASEDETQAKREINPSDQKCLCGTRILLTEDNDLNAEIATELLQEEGCTVDRAKDGVECVDMLEKAANGTYQLILMDIQMPVMNGYDAAKKIRRMDDPQKAGIPIIAMTQMPLPKIDRCTGCRNERPYRKADQYECSCADFAEIPLMRTESCRT